MSEQDAVLSSLAVAGVLDGIRWAYLSAGRRTAEDFDEATGHNATWAGVTRWILLCDRLDRVFSCGRYATAGAGAEHVGLDVLFATLTDTERQSFPRIDPSIVKRSDLQGSPGWEYAEVRWLLASVGHGSIDHVAWTRKSRLKQRAATQPPSDRDQMSILDVLVDDPVAASLASTLDQVDDFDVRTLVVAHSWNLDTADRELVLGLPSLESGSGWVWRQSLLTVAPAGPGTRKPTMPDTSPPSDVEDAPVRLRQPLEMPGESDNAGSGGSRPAGDA